MQRRHVAVQVAGALELPDGVEGATGNVPGHVQRIEPAPARVAVGFPAYVVPAAREQVVQPYDDQEDLHSPEHQPPSVHQHALHQVAHQFGEPQDPQQPEEADRPQRHRGRGNALVDEVARDVAEQEGAVRGKSGPQEVLHGWPQAQLELAVLVVAGDQPHRQVHGPERGGRPGRRAEEALEGDVERQRERNGHQVVKEG
mmetsp:Transcript_13171/g.37180  ORF Transcript_13171/g.37180 Transcript_13171/m.37180 type:complete len:200 (-) Transcript_13171:512-1111(-)